MIEVVLIVPSLLESTEHALQRGIHPMIVAARFHGFYEYLHPFRDGNGRTGRLLSNFILLRAGYPMFVIKSDLKDTCLTALRMIRKEGTDEHLIHLFFNCAIDGMKEVIEEKRTNSMRLRSFLF